MAKQTRTHTTFVERNRLDDDALFLKPVGVSRYGLALAIGVPESCINAIDKPRSTKLAGRSPA